LHFLAIRKENSRGTLSCKGGPRFVEKYDRAKELLNSGKFMTMEALTQRKEGGGCAF
jgi:hypothetical protein